MLEQRRPCNADIRAADDNTVDVPAQTSAGDAEAKLLVLTAPGSEMEPGRLQPANRQVSK
jgi:hypothetical protein